MDTARYIELITKRLTTSLSSEETAMLEKWLAEQPENQKLADSIIAAWEGSEDYKTAFKADKKKAWSKIKGYMDEHPAEEKPEAKVIQMNPNRKRNQWAMAAGLLVIVSMAATIWWYLGQIEASLIVAQTNAFETKVIDLPDGSKVNLRPNSSLSYPENFSGDTRDIAMTGTAYFEVQHNPAQPFVIQSPHAATTVLGTSFQVTDFKASEEATVLVNTGKVRFQPNTSEKNITLTKGEEGVFNIAEKRLQKATTPDFNRLAWLTGSMNFKEQALSTIVQTLETNFGIIIRLENNDLGNCTFTANFDLNQQNLDQILEALQLALSLEIEKTDEKKYLLKGSGCE
ncbi:MAG: FecR domain-containing protein [Saprospiraceae bacterium]|nr:FecR domain-containing protein [Saprospiraceae bacterium]